MLESSRDQKYIPLNCLNVINMIMISSPALYIASPAKNTTKIFSEALSGSYGFVIPAPCVAHPALDGEAPEAPVGMAVSVYSGMRVADQVLR